MEKKKTGFLPGTQKEWHKTIRFIENTVHSSPERFKSCETSAQQIRLYIKTLSTPVDDICRKTCVSCKDICCQRATIWYDFKDLLYLQFSVNRLPRYQISKTGHAAGSACRNFTSRGCSLSRICRPFVCTWYFCPDQKLLLKMTDPGLLKTIEQTLSDIKEQRSRLAAQFLEITQNPDVEGG